MELREFREKAEKLEGLEKELKSIVHLLNNLDVVKEWRISDFESPFSCKISGDNLKDGLLKEFECKYKVYESGLKELQNAGVKVYRTFNRDIKIYKVVRHLLWSEEQEESNGN